MPSSGDLQQATFAEVEKQQRELIFDYLQILIKEKRTLTEKEQEDFWGILAFSTLGLGVDQKFILKQDGNQYDLGTIEDFARHLSFIKEEIVELKIKGTKIEVPIEQLWQSLQDCLYNTMAKALTRSFDQSSEIVARKGGAYEFPSIKKEKKKK